MPPVPLIVNEYWLPLSVMLLEAPKVNVPLPLTVSFSASTIGASISWVPLRAETEAPLPKAFRVKELPPVPLIVTPAVLRAA